jgi:hypothetical protein
MIVALSRARHALYIFGNAEMLQQNQPQAQSSETNWKAVIEALQQQGHIGTALPFVQT